MTTWRGTLALCTALAIAGLAVAAVADVLELRDGRALEGRLRGASEQALHFETAEGVVKVPRSQAARLVFAAPAGAAAPAPAAATPAATAPPAAAAAEPTPTRVQIPAGTRLRVRVADSLDPRQSAQGDRFSAHLEEALAADGVALVPARAVAYGVVTASRITGPAVNQLQLELTELQIRGQAIPIVTGTQERVSADAPGADGAPASAAASAGARIASGSLLEFRLLQPLELQVQH